MVQKELHRNTEQHEPGEHSGALDEQAEFGKIPKKELHRNTEQHEPGRAFRCSGRQFGKIPKKELHKNTEQHEPGEHSGALDEQAVW